MKKFRIIFFICFTVFDIAYHLAPVDFVADAIPVAGALDDMVVAGINMALTLMLPRKEAE